MRTLYSMLADLILMAHALVVLFIVGALPVIWMGYFRDWKFVRNFGFRVAHLVLIAVVVGETLLGATCPLTSWEDMWLAKAGVGPRNERGFVSSWIHRLLFYDLDEKVFIVAYSLFLALVVFTFIWVKPRRDRQQRCSP